eukprot:6786078-Prymnesium_polylepis.1
MSFYLSGTLVSVVTGFPPAYMAAILLVLPIAAAFTVPLEVLTGVCALQLLSFRLGMRIEATLLKKCHCASHGLGIRESAQRTWSLQRSRARLSALTREPRARGR